MVQKDKKIYGRNMGIGCDLKVCGKTEEEVISKVGKHVLAMHGIEGFSKDFHNKAQKAIHGGNGDYGDTEETVPEECSDSYET